MKVLIESYSRYFDVQTRVQFSPVLDQRSGCYVGVADLPEEVAECYLDRPGFEVLSDEEFVSLTSAPEKPVPAASQSGDPLTDQANVGSGAAAPAGGSTPAGQAPPPPPPPPSK
ncbi:MAG TPA: hypothetical protein VK689_00615 [Armatimonadota bacterium]|nr:hypothetical protein [Armatimonadota bacterium]